MATSLNALVLKIGADTSGLSAGVKAVRSDVNKVNRIMRQTATDSDKTTAAIKSLNRVYKTGALSAKEYARGLGAIAKQYGVTSKLATIARRSALAAAAAFAGVAYKVKQSFESIDKLAKTSDKLGIGTEKLIALRFAAEETGVATQTLDMALQRMVRRIAEAGQGTGEAKNAIKELGLNAQQLAAKSPDEQFKAIAEAMKGVNSESDQLRLAFKLFDSEGAALVNTLRVGAEGLTQYEKDAQALGITISRYDAAQIEQANDAIGRLGLAMGGLTTRIAGSLAPILTAVANKLVELQKYMNGFSEGTRTNAKRMVVFTGTFVTFLLVVPRILNAIRSIITAIRIWRTTQIGLLAISGPAGWAMLAGGVLAAGAAVAAFNVIASEQNEHLERTAKNATAAGLAVASYNAEAAGPAKMSGGSGSATAKEHIARLRKMRDEMQVMTREKLIQKVTDEGARAVELYNLKQLIKQTDQMKKQKKLDQDRMALLKKRQAEFKSNAEAWRKEADRVKEKFKTPFEKLTDELTKINQMQMGGLLDRNTADKARREASSEFANQTKPLRVELPPSIAKGSRAEYQLIAERQNKTAQMAARRHVESQATRKAQQLAAERAATAAEESVIAMRETAAAIEELELQEAV